MENQLPVSQYSQAFGENACLHTDARFSISSDKLSCFSRVSSKVFSDL